MVWGYVFGKAIGRYQRLRPSIPLLLLMGALPDFDLFLRQPYGTLFGHHGISHSWLVIGLLSIPFFYKFGKQAAPYFVAVIQHPLFGDLTANQIPLRFPLTLSEDGLRMFEWVPQAAIASEILGFAIFLFLFISARDWKHALRSGWDKLWLVLWLPVLGLTAAQAVWYFEPSPATLVYSVYAMISTVFLAVAALMMVLHSRQLEAE